VSACSRRKRFRPDTRARLSLCAHSAPIGVWQRIPPRIHLMSQGETLPSYAARRNRMYVQWNKGAQPKRAQTGGDAPQGEYDLGWSADGQETEVQRCRATTTPIRAVPDASHLRSLLLSPRIGGIRALGSSLRRGPGNLLPRAPRALEHIAQPAGRQHGGSAGSRARGESHGPGQEASVLAEATSQAPSIMWAPSSEEGVSWAAQHDVSRPPGPDVLRSPQPLAEEELPEACSYGAW
jgi:hypothetical protein